MRKSLPPMIRFRNAARAMLAVSAIFAVAVSAVTLTQERALGDSHEVKVSIYEEGAIAQEVTVVEGATVNIVVHLSTSVASDADPVPIPVRLGASDDTAVAADYNVSSNPADFEILAGNRDGTLSIVTINDTENPDPESLETLTVSLGKVPLGYLVNDERSSVTITIIDDDNAGDPTGDVVIDVKDSHGDSVDENDEGQKIVGFIPKVGHVLTANTEGIYDRDNDSNNDNDHTDDENEALKFTYQWMRTDGSENVAIDGAKSSTYELTDKDVGGKFSVRVGSSDRFGNGNDTPFDLDFPAETSIIAYNLAKPFIIVVSLEPSGVGMRLEPNVVLVRDSSGMSSSRTDGGGILIELDQMGIPVPVTVDLDGDGRDRTSVPLSDVTFTWYRGEKPIKYDDDNLDSTLDVPDIRRTYTLTKEDVAKTITLRATWVTSTATGATSDPVVSAPLDRVYSSNRATGMPTISGIGQVGHTLTVAEGDIADADNGSDGFGNPMFSYQWLRGGEPIAGAVFSSYTLTGADGGEMISVVASFTDNLGDREETTSLPTLPIVASPGKISRIEPAIGDITVSGGDEVTLSVDVYGRQDAKDNGLSGTFTWRVDGEVDGDLGTGREAKFTAPDDPGRYTVAASLEAVDCYDEDDDETCMAEFVVMVRRPSAPVADPVPPVNPPGDIPGLIPDADGNQYEVFTPEEGGTFDGGEGYSISVPSGAVPNGEYIGIRMSDDGAASNAGQTHQRYTLGGNMYGVHAVDASGALISSYVLETPAEACVPLPASLRTNISRLSLAAINSDGSLTILAAQVRLDESGGTMVCGNLSSLPASVAVGSAGAPAAIPTATPVPEPELPPTGGTSPTSSTLMFWTLLLGIAVLTLGSALATIRRRESVRK